MISKKPNAIKLTSEDIAELKLLLTATAPGKYTLRQLHGEELWQHELRPQAFGLAFKAAVTARKLQGILTAGKRSDRAQLYEVLPREQATSELRDAVEEVG